MEDKFARIEIDGWELNDGEAIHHQHSDTFWIPSFEARSNLKTGQLVKLIFQIITEDGAGVEESVAGFVAALSRHRHPERELGALSGKPTQRTARR